MSETMDEVYHERDQVIALAVWLALQSGLSVWIGEHERSDAAWESDWRHIVYIRLPTGQVSWHIHKSELGLFRLLPSRASVGTWDGHTVEEKYDRLERYVTGISDPWLERVQARLGVVGRERARALSILHQIYDLGIDPTDEGISAKARALLTEAEALPTERENMEGPTS